MFSKTPTGRASKGSVSIINSHERLQLRFRYQGKRYYISTGFVDNPANRKLAELKASEIEKDILCERLDLTLGKYQPQSALSTITPITPIRKSQPHLDELWDKYSEFKKPQVSPSTYAKDFSKHSFA
jgi:integrase